MKKIFVALFAAMAMNTGMAQDITVMRIGAPGANSDFYATVVGTHLQNRGWKTKTVSFLDCKGAEKWVRDNPREPVIYVTWADDFVLPSIDPNHPRSCPGLTLDQDSLVTPIVKSYHMVCSRNPVTAQTFLQHRDAKIGSWNHPVQMRIVRDALKDLDLSQTKLISFARGADMLQALVSGDIDYMVVSSENLVRNIGGQCFLTMAPRAQASRMSDFRTSGTQTSIESLVERPTWVGTGLIPLYVAYNVDIDRLRKDVVDIMSTSTEFQNLWSSSTVKSGVMTGITPEQQWQEFNRFLSQMKRQ